MANIVQLKAGAPIVGIVPQTIEEVFRLAKGIADSGLAPKDLNTSEKVMVAILTGLEIGLPPMFAIQKIAVINGRPTIWGDAVPALLWSRGFKLREWTDAETAHCEVSRPEGDKIERTFSLADAKKAGLAGKPGPWQQYPSRMLQMRARGFACRDGAADVLGGLYLREEIEEPMRDITPAKAAPLEIPDNIPDTKPSEAEQSQALEPDKEADTPLADADGLLAKIEEDISLCTSAQELAEIAEHNESMIMRLPTEKRKKAWKMLSEAAE